MRTCPKYCLSDGLRVAPLAAGDCIKHGRDFQIEHVPEGVADSCVGVARFAGQTPEIGKQAVVAALAGREIIFKSADQAFVFAEEVNQMVAVDSRNQE